MSANAADFLYVVQPGDHLWNIAQRFLQRPAQAAALLRLNQIPDERRLMPGSRLHIPSSWLRLESARMRLAALAGEVSVERGPGGARPAVAGEWLQPPAVLRTSATGSASLELSDGSKVLVLRDSELKLRRSETRVVDAAGVVHLELLRGGLENDVRPRQPHGGRFEIHTPAAIAAVRGTRFRVHADGGEAPQARTEVLSGAVQVASPAGQVTALASQGSVAQLHAPPRPPVTLLPAPDLANVPTRVERLPVDLSFPRLDGARAYRVQVVPGPAFEVTLADDTRPEPRLRLSELRDGRYMLRVRGIDAQGLEGLSAQHLLELDAQPEPPLLMEPVPGRDTTAARPAFRWTESATARTYRLQVSLDGPFVPLIDQVVRGSQAELEQELPLGAYQWRVASIEEPQGQGPFSDAQRFRRVRPGPQAQAVSSADAGTALRWSALPDTARYHLQVARDAAFAEPVIDELTDAQQYTLPALTPGTHYVRVQAIADGGDSGLWGGTQSFTVPEPSASRWPLLLFLLPLVLF